MIRIQRKIGSLYGTTVAISALAAAVLSMDASAQTSPSRASVKADAAASAPALGSNRQGDQTVTTPGTSTESRDQKRAEGAQTSKTGTNRQGEQTTPSQSQGSKPRASAESRADVKAGAVAANKPTGDKPMGEASQKGQDKGQTKP